MAPPPAPAPPPPRARLALLAAALLAAAASGDADPPDPVYLPAHLEVLDVPEYYRLQRADRDLPANASLRARSETYLLLRHGAAPRPLVRAAYAPFSARQAAPAESPPRQEASAGWSIRAVPVESAASPAQPFARVLFHLQGPDWLPGPRELPCVALQAQHRGRAARGSCRLQAPLGVCVVELEIPPAWFSEPAEPAELYYGECGRAGGRPEGLRRAGRLELRGAEAARRQEVRLDDKVLLRVPEAALRPGQLFTATLVLRHNFTADQLTLRVKAKKGLQVVAARPAAPAAWAAQLERSRGAKHSTAVVTCRRRGAGGRWPARAAEGAELLHLDLAVENGTGGAAAAAARPVTWQVEYPGQDAEAQKDKMVWEIQVSERDIRALVPLAQELEIVNTAPLSGVPRAVPVKLVAVEAGGGVAQVAEQLGCESADKQVLQVADACDAVFVAGKESRGARGARVDFWFRRFHASLRFTVWAPLLPLRVDLRDTTLEQVRGWRLPGASADSGPAEAEEPGEEAERRARGCRPQYQRTAVRFLAHFVAHPLDGGRHLAYLPGAEWLLDVSHLVAARARVVDPRVASLEGGTVVVGREPGVTSVEVRSPVSDSILGEQTLVVSEEKVTVTELRAQVVSGLSLTVTAEPGHPDVIVAACQGTTALRSPKQEATLSVWLAFSDHTLAPLELYGWQEATLAVASPDAAVASVRPPGATPSRPLLVAEGTGRGALLQLSLHAPDACRKGRHRAAPLATGTAWLEVGHGRRPPTPGSPKHRGGRPRPSSPFPRAEGAMSGEAVTAPASEPRRRDPAGVGPASTKLQGLGSSSEEEEEEEEDGYGHSRANGEEEEEEEMVKAPERVTDLEIGMYVLLGVFCLAIFIFLINCVFFVLRYQHKEPLDAGAAASAPQPHNWVWLGTDQEELSRQLDRRQPEPSTQLAPGPQAGAEGGRCCCGVPPGAVPAPGPAAEEPGGSPLLGAPTPGATPPRKEGGAPGGGRRKRVEFVTFAPPRAPEEPPLPASNVQSILVASEDDIRWVCEDMGLRDPEELRSYMERIRGSS
ncbi:transmembrane protein 132A isoform X2 [Apteryx mantelli]|uniref:Transmembrane protein 132A isoform X2 n=1 Tax=Apteryx mantelli TaxID=2696672 RepID=A0ABM4EGN1_9AVES